MNSSIKQLKDTLDVLTEYGYFTPYGTDALHGISVAGSAQDLATSFQEVNSSLSEAWDNARIFSEKIFNGVPGLVSELYRDVDAYIEAVERGELELLTAIENANQAAQTILAELGL